MTEPMTFDRFRDLADAYGGDVTRWPAEARAAAMALATHPTAIAILAHATALDTVLDSWAVPAPSPALAARLVGLAPTPNRSPAARARLWWSGVGIAAALAGAASGTAAVAMVSPNDVSPESGTSFGAIDPQEG